MTEIPIERAYAEACQALGEAVVLQRLLNAELARLQELVEQTTATAPDIAT